MKVEFDDDSKEFKPIKVSITLETIHEVEALREFMNECSDAPFAAWEKLKKVTDNDYRR